MTSTTSAPSIQISRHNQFFLWFSRHWIFVVSILVGLYALAPFLAPVFMNAGLTFPARIIYWIYSFLCHQLPERSYFLFGPKISYSISEIQAVWRNTTNDAILRQFVGTPQMGWKVAWSDRMVSMYLSLWIFGIVWGFLKKKIKPLPWWGLVLLLIPMVIDGTTHLISDLAGLGQGFRDTNTWLVALTNNTLPVSFYAGDAWGSFNSLMRLITGVLFGLGIVWAAYPYIDESILSSAEAVKYNDQRSILLREARDRLAGMYPKNIPLPNEIQEKLSVQREDENEKRS